MNTYQRVYVMVNGLFCQLVHYLITLSMAWHPLEADTSAIVAQRPEEVHDMADKRVFSIFTLKIESE